MSIPNVANEAVGNPVAPTATVTTTTNISAEPGYTTTEFWVTGITVISSLLIAFHPGFKLPVPVEQAGAWAAGIATGIYSLARSFRKHGTNG
jgi:hypothetical protein